MTRRVENAVIIDGPAAAMLSQAANLDQLRIEARGKSDRLYALLYDIHATKLAYFASKYGTKPLANEENDLTEIEGFTTAKNLAKRAGTTPRTIRNHINAGLLQAQLHDRHWIIRNQDAEQYLAARQPA